MSQWTSPSAAGFANREFWMDVCRWLNLISVLYGLRCVDLCIILYWFWHLHGYWLGSFRVAAAIAAAAANALVFQPAKTFSARLGPLGSIHNLCCFATRYNSS